MSALYSALIMQATAWLAKFLESKLAKKFKK